jgi:hypothetical protein
MTVEPTDQGPHSPAPEKPDEIRQLRPADDLSLAGFPRVVAQKYETVWRSHRIDLSPFWFSKTGEGRFDIRERGTMYCATDSKTATLERLRGEILSARVVTREFAAGFVVTPFQLPMRFSLAGISRSRAVEYGVTRSLVTTSDYGLAQHWAAVFAASKFGGIKYGSGYTSGPARALALFGCDEWADPVPGREMSGERACREVGVEVLGPPRTESLRISDLEPPFEPIVIVERP